MCKERGRGAAGYKQNLGGREGGAVGGPLREKGEKLSQLRVTIFQILAFSAIIFALS